MKKTRAGGPPRKREPGQANPYSGHVGKYVHKTNCIYPVGRKEARSTEEMKEAARADGPAAMQAYNKHNGEIEKLKVKDIKGIAAFHYDVWITTNNKAKAVEELTGLMACNPITLRSATDDDHDGTQMLQLTDSTPVTVAWQVPLSPITGAGDGLGAMLPLNATGAGPSSLLRQGSPQHALFADEDLLDVDPLPGVGPPDDLPDNLLDIHF